MSPVNSDEILQRVTRIESRFDSLREHLDESHLRLGDDLKDSRQRLEKDLKESHQRLGDGLKESHQRLNDGLKELKDLLSAHIDTTDQRLDDLKMEVAWHTWVLRCVTGISVPVIAATVPVLLNHYFRCLLYTSPSPRDS